LARVIASDVKARIMGKAYNQDQRDRVKVLLEAGRDEETIEKDTGVSDRTIRRWKMELERTGRIGKPPESRTGRHRVLNPEVETVSLSRVDMSGSVRAAD
jgi:transposase